MIRRQGQTTPTRDAEPAIWSIDRRSLRRAARQYGPPWSLAGLLWRQHRAERRLRRNGTDFRHRANAAACEAYTRMDDADFVEVNARQAWANWRTIPRNIDGLLPDRPLHVVDLCCGTGDAISVLSWCCPPGSHFLGLEIADEFLRRAAARRFPDQQGAPASVRFTAQSVLEPFRDPDGRELPAASVDLVNASGAVGCHFDAAATTTLATECRRVIRPGGLATIDAGPDGTAPAEVRAIFERLGFRHLRSARSCLVDRFRHLCMRRLPT